MQIVVNTRLLLKNKLDGIGWFSYQTLKRITNAHPDVHFVFLFDRNYDDEFVFADNITPLVIGPQARHPFLYYAWFHMSVKSLLNKMKPDLFLSPDGFLALGAKCKQLPVIHDINFLHNPKDSKYLTAKYYNYFFPKYAQAACRIATVSEYSKNDISKNYRISPDKIDVVYNGINDGYMPLAADEQQKVRDKYTQGNPYFLFVGSLSPRKNLARLLQAFEIFKAQQRTDMKLVLVGTVYCGEGEVKRVLDKMQFKEEVVFAGRLDQEELEKVMASSFALTYVPYFEGFGIPLVEAMQCDIPVISSNTTSMPEIAGNAALLVDPFKAEEIAQAMSQLYNDSALREQLVVSGRKQKEHFSWDKSAGLLWNSITKCL